MLESGTIEISNSQDSGRVEVLQGKIELIENNDFKIEFNSIVLENDPRLVQTKRIFEISFTRSSPTKHSYRPHYTVMGPT